MSDGRRRTPAGAEPGARQRAPYYPPHGEPLRAPWDPEESTPGRRRSVPGSRDHLRKQTPVGRFFATWGWRAYAIPVLVVLTALVIADAVVSPDAQPDDGAVRAQETPAIVGAPAAGEVPPSGELPEGGPFVEAAGGEFRLVPGGTDPVGRPTAEQFTYTVEVEDGIDTVDFGGDDSVARMIDATLANPKSWTADGAVASPAAALRAASTVTTRRTTTDLDPNLDTIDIASHPKGSRSAIAAESCEPASPGPSGQV